MHFFFSWSTLQTHLNEKECSFWDGFWSRADSRLFTEVPPTHTPGHANVCIHVAPCSLHIPLSFSSCPLCPPKSFCLFKSSSCLILQASLSSLSRPQTFSLFGALRTFISVPSWHEMNHCLDLFSHSASFPEKIYDTPRAKTFRLLQIMPLSCLRISGGPLWPRAVLL